MKDSDVSHYTIMDHVTSPLIDQLEVDFHRDRVTTNMLFSLPHLFHLSSKKRQEVLSLYQKVYASETESNFRFISLLLGTRSKYVLTEADRLDDGDKNTDSDYAFLSDIGQYTEIAHGSISPTFVFQNIDELCQPGFPLDDYKALRNDKAILLHSFRGSVAAVQGYVVFRPHSKQLVLAFSGTSNLSQALRDVQAYKVAYLEDKSASSMVHLGFWSMYCGIKHKALEALQLGFAQHSDRVTSLVLTGHSMGATLCYLLALDLMTSASADPFDDHNYTVARSIPSGIPLIVVLFGSPRLGDNGLVQFWRQSIRQYRHRFGQEIFREYSIKAYNDGVHVLPPCWMGYQHLTDSPLYLYHGHLYKIPSRQREYGVFAVAESQAQKQNRNFQSHSHDMQKMTASVNQHATSPLAALTVLTASSPPPSHSVPHIDRLIWPRGGHNYYFRDMENLQRRIKWLELELRGEKKWRERYKLRLEMWEAKWGHPVVQFETAKN